jgi:hypothetical protein
MNKDNKDIPNKDFECNPEGDCWCKEEEYKLPIPILEDNKLCYSPREIKEVINKLKNEL